MRVYLAVLKLYLKSTLQYRGIFLASLLADPMTHILNIFYFTAIYSFNRAQALVGYDLSQMIWYFAGITLVWQCVWNSADSNISHKILSGDFSIDLLRPVSYFCFELADAVAARMIGFVFEFLPSLMLYSLLFYPKFLTPAALGKFMLTVGLAFCLFFLINYLIGLTAFQLQNNYSIQSIKFVVISLTAGGYIPLEFFPAWFNQIIAYLPFQYLFYWPIQFFLNKENTWGMAPLAKIVLMQLGWIIGLFWLCQVVWKRAIQKYCAVGG